MDGWVRGSCGCIVVNVRAYFDVVFQIIYTYCSLEIGEVVYSMKKLLVVVCLLVILAPLVVEAQAPSGNMTSSMVSFFRQERTRLNTNTVSRDEMFVYAVFLSNFLRPGITTIRDLTGDDLVSSVSTRFFGQPKNVEDLRDIHNRISEEIVRSISGEGLAALKTDSSLRNHLTGTQLLTMLASGGEKRAYTRRPVSYTHLTLPTNREV